MPHIHTHTRHHYLSGGREKKWIWKALNDDRFNVLPFKIRWHCLFQGYQLKVGSIWILKGKQENKTRKQKTTSHFQLVSMVNAHMQCYFHVRFEFYLGKIYSRTLQRSAQKQINIE